MTLTSDLASLPKFRYSPRPTYGPKRDYSYYTEEPSITKISRAMGQEPQPWQRYVWAVATEYRLDERGRRAYHYNEVLITVPRQSGKSTLLRPLRIYRMLINPMANLFSTAQTQKHASKRMIDMVNYIDRSPMADFFKTRRGKGDAGAHFLPNGSDIAQFTPNEEALHGETTPYTDLDEIWYLTRVLGTAIMGGIRPAQITLGGMAQRWMTSTMGTLESEFMNDQVEDGRSGKAGMCFIEYSKPPNLDPYDPATWWMFHPALGNTITEESLQLETDLPEAEFLRAYCNVLTDVAETFMPLENWDDLAGEYIIPPLSQVTVGYEVAPGNVMAAVVAGWHTSSGQPVAHVLHQAQGTKWLPDYLHDLKRAGATHFAADDAGPVRRLNDSLADALNPQVLSFADRRLADQTLISAARDEFTLIHDGSRPLRVAVANAVLRVNNGVELIDRDKSTQPVPALIAASIALYANAHPLADVRPFITV